MAIKIDQMALKFAKSFIARHSKNLPELGFFV
jgi:hypothetical protein